MKARVKATGEIVEVEDCGSVFRHGALFHGYKGANGIKYLPDEIELQMDFDYWEACHDEAPEHIPDYWTRLEHTYAGMAMQGMLNNSLLTTGLLKAGKSHEDFVDEVTRTALRYAHALVEKLKEKEEK